MHGYGGRILHVDLAGGASRVEAFDEAFARAFLGGNGFAARILFDRMAPGIDPFDPRNVVALAVGPITDTTVPGNSRCCIATKSPLTGLFFDSTFGGRFPCTMKRTGFDAIAIAGRAPRPVYLLVDEAGAHLRQAEDLWGLTTAEAVGAIAEREGGEVDAIAIGPAGERLVRFACLAHYWKNREGISGRGGIGAVFGAKHLKAVAVRGQRKTAVADAEAIKAVVEAGREPMKKGTAALARFGTPALTQPINALGALGSYNLRVEQYPDWQAINGEQLRERFFDKDTTCLKCPVACGKTYAVREGEYAGTRAKMPEFETLFALGSMAGNSDGAALTVMNDRCDKLGLDTISLGVTIAFAMECFEVGLLSEREVGFPLRFGDPHAILRLVEMTARREGFGDRLAEGSARLAAAIGGEASRYLYTSRRLEIAGHSARALKGMTLGYAVGTRGGSHHDVRPTPQYAADFDKRSPEGKPAYAVRSHHFTAVDDSLVACRFTSERGYGMLLNDNYVGMVNGATGWGLDLAELERIGERIVNLERMFNVREGLRRKDDTLPYRVMHEPIPDGPSKGAYCPPEELGRMLDEYYALRGWSKDGVPTPQTLRRLGLAFALQP